MTGNTNVNESFMNTMDPNPIMMDEDHTLHHEPIQNVQHPDESNDDDDDLNYYDDEEE